MILKCMKSNPLSLNPSKTDFLMCYSTSLSSVEAARTVLPQCLFHTKSSLNL